MAPEERKTGVIARRLTGSASSRGVSSSVALALLLFGALAGLLAGCTRPAQAPDAALPAPVVEVVPEQEILSALPLRVRLPERYGAQRVLVFFRTWGSDAWNVIELARSGQTWTGEISCRDVSTVTGDTRYFFLALDPNADPVASSGSAEWPHVETTVKNLPDGARALTPEEAPPIQCHDPADCPPDFPGCPAYASRRTACTVDKNCDRGTHCAWDGYCEAKPANVAIDARPDVSDEELLAKAVRAAKRSAQAPRRAPKEH